MGELNFRNKKTGKACSKIILFLFVGNFFILYFGHSNNQHAIFNISIYSRSIDSTRDNYFSIKWAKITFSSKIIFIFIFSGITSFSFNNNDVIYLWGTQSIYKSIDGGNNFSNLNVPFSGVNDLFVANDGVIYSATDKGVHRSFDGGWSWVIMDSLLPKNLPSGAVVYNNEKKSVLAGFNGKLYISEDGVSWSIKTVGVNSISMIKINPLNANEVLVGMKK